MDISLARTFLEVVRSGSLIAPIALHWSLNGLGALAAALVWHLS